MPIAATTLVPIASHGRRSQGKLRDNISAYDAMYVALAEGIQATVVICDRPLATAPGHRARIELIE